MTDYTPERVDDLVTTALTWNPAECAASPVGAWHTIERLADALEAEHNRAESMKRQRDTARHGSIEWESAFSRVEGERDEALDAIAELRALHYEHENTLHATPATVCAHRYCVDGMGDQVAWPCPTGRILSRIPEHPKED